MNVVLNLKKKKKKMNVILNERKCHCTLSSIANNFVHFSVLYTFYIVHPNNKMKSTYFNTLAM